jgi:hypothetical protein
LLPFITMSKKVVVHFNPCRVKPLMGVKYWTFNGVDSFCSRSKGTMKLLFVFLHFFFMATDLIQYLTTACWKQTYHRNTSAWIAFLYCPSPFPA